MLCGDSRPSTHSRLASADQGADAQFSLVYALPDGTAVWFVSQRDRLIEARHVGKEDHPEDLHRIRMNH